MQLVELHKLVRNSSADNSTNQLNNLIANFIILDYPSHFEIISNKSTLPVHLLQKNDTGSLNWIKSSRLISGISKFVDKEQIRLGEDELINLIEVNNQPAIICDSPGMGKSDLLAYLAKKLEEKYQERAVLFLTMTQLVNEIRQKIISRDFLESALIRLTCSNKLEIHSLRSKLRMDTNEILIELLVDGFDEINSSDDCKAFEMLKLIQSFKSVRLWITSRPHLMQNLENILGVLGFTIHPFTFQNQLNYLVDYWSIGNREESVDRQKLKEFALHCLDPSRLADTPLQCLLIGVVYKKCTKLLLQVYKEDALEFTKSSANKPFTKCIDSNSISELYGHLIKRKIDSYFKLVGKSGQNEEKLMDYHFKLSLNLIFPQHSDLWDEVMEPFDKDEILKIGLVQFHSNSNIPTFIHRTFAEYFVALFISEWLKRKCVQNVTGGEKIIEYVLEEILNVCKTSCEILGMDYTSFLFRHGLICTFLDEKVIDFGESEEHKALFKEANKTINVNGIVHACANSGFNNILQLLYKVGSFPATCLDFSLAAIAIRNDRTIFEFLMSKGLISLEVVDENQNTLLHAAAALCKIEAVKFITLQKGPLFAKNKEGSTPLHIAASIKNEKCLDILKLLIEAGTGALALDNEKRTFLHILAKNDILTPANFHDFAEFLIGRKLSKLFNFEGWENRATPMQWIIGKIEPDKKTLERLHSSQVNFNYVNAFGGSLFTFALLGGRSIKCLSNLIQLDVDPRRVDNNNAGELHLSCELGNIEAVKMFLKIGLDINAVDISGCTPLHRAAQFNTEKLFELAKLLLDNGADANAKNSNGLTPLGIIIKREIDEDLKLNLAKLFGVNFKAPASPTGMDVDIPGQEMEPHSSNSNDKDATFASTFSMMKFLLESGADAYAKDKDNLTLLHKLVWSNLCSPSQLEEITKYLIEKDQADLFNVPGGVTDYTPLQLAMERLDLNEETPELSKLCSKMNKSINVKTKHCDKVFDGSVLPGSSTAPASQPKDYSTSITQIKRKEFVPDTVLEQVYNAMRQCELDSKKSIKTGGKILFQHIFTEEEKLECSVSGKQGRRQFPSEKVQNMSRALSWLLKNPPVRTLSELNRVKEEPLDSRLLAIFRQSILIEYAYVARSQIRKPSYLSKAKKARSSPVTAIPNFTASQTVSDDLPSSSIKRSRMTTPPTQILTRTEVNRQLKSPDRKQDQKKKENFPTRRSPRKLRDVSVY